MNVSIIGAGGVIGRQIVITLVQERIIPMNARLQLVGHIEGKSKSLLYGLASDLVDAYAEIIPEIDVCLDPEKVYGDIIIFAAGKSSVNEPGKLHDRQALASLNLPVFESYAQILSENRKHGEEIVVIVTNPVELGVEIFSRYFERSHVIGMGAFSDTLRFRREIAAELGCRRQNVQGLVLGEHGMGMVPCWSTVKVYGYMSSKKQEEIAALRNHPCPERQAAVQEAIRLLFEENAREAYKYVSSLRADIRTFVRPVVTYRTGSNTPVATAEIVSRLVETIVDGKQILAAAQVSLKGEFLNIHGVTGAPVILSNQGARIVPVELWPEEAIAVHNAAKRFKEYLAKMES
ncbi:MAG: lactate dehydrogenase [Planctomycetes bacterium]|nr:lactate dehydrogenase [Planctomycetota bacterium]